MASTKATGTTQGSASAAAQPAAGPEKPKLTAQEKKILFAAADKADKEVDDTEVLLEELREHRSDAIKAIHDAMGKGPFDYKGRTLSIAVRTPEGGKANYFWRGTPREVEHIA